MTEATRQLPAPTPQPTPRRPSLWPLWLCALLALVAVAVLALWNWQQWRERQASETQLQSLQQDIRRLEAQYGDRDSLQGQRLQALEDKLAAQRELIAQQQRQIDHNARALLEAGHRTRTDWLLAEAEYLLRIANQRLQVEKDIGGALAALTAADEVLAESDDIGVYPVRQQLAREQLALKSIEPVDRTGLYLTLEAAIDSINRLTDQALIHEAAPGFLASTDDEVSTDTTADGPLGRAWQRFKNTLAQVVVVRRLDEPVKPLLSPDQSAYARLNLQLMLEEAEMAVLRGNQALYERALAKTRAALADWYHPDHPPVAALNDTLADLAGRDIAPELPDISQSLRLLKQRLAGRLASPDDAPEARAATGGDAS
ncbi:uroporphyrinogen-III C-methyltransferase [uncultured Marinobacter sp.]|uniref:uroporphyrinogen-III C-methyltransferase n=1 Tax=Marinobacter lutaoensis TaxID=135739 RepID=UPI000C0AE07A|nr:hypothetical protein [Marinobacter sp.]MBI44113.1 hypothetical protein [Oceanospirillales bacterium]NVD36661.1 uroporphyrinogen-III C-methyltransferase [Marinobacter lutaoensis]